MVDTRLGSDPVVHQYVERRTLPKTLKKNNREEKLSVEGPIMKDLNEANLRQLVLG